MTIAPVHMPVRHEIAYPAGFRVSLRPAQPGPALQSGAAGSPRRPGPCRSANLM